MSIQAITAPRDKAMGMSWISHEPSQPECSYSVTETQSLKPDKSVQMVLLGSFPANATLVSQKPLPFAGLMAEKAQMPKLSFPLCTWSFDSADQLSLKTLPQFPWDSSFPREAPGELCPHLPV